jgi:hypothetical protein
MPMRMKSPDHISENAGAYVYPVPVLNFVERFDEVFGSGRVRGQAATLQSEIDMPFSRPLHARENGISCTPRSL